MIGVKVCEDHNGRFGSISFEVMGTSILDFSWDMASYNTTSNACDPCQIFFVGDGTLTNEVEMEISYAWNFGTFANCLNVNSGRHSTDGILFLTRL